MLIPFILEENSDLFNNNVEIDEYIFKNYLEGISFDAKGQILLNEESSSLIEKKIKDFIETEGEKFKKVKKDLKNDINSSYWIGIIGTGLYLLGIAIGVTGAISFSPTTLFIGIILSLISMIGSMIVGVLKMKSIQNNVGKLKSYRDMVSRYIRQTKNSKIKEKLLDLKQEIDDGLNSFGGGSIIVKESEDLNIIEDYDEFKLFNEFLEEF